MHRTPANPTYRTSETFMNCLRCRLHIILVALTALLSVEAQAGRGQAPPAVPPRAANAAAEPLRTAVDRPIDIRDIRLELRVDLSQKNVDSKADIQFRSLRPIKSIS